MFFNKIANFKKAAMLGFVIAAFSTNGNAGENYLCLQKYNYCKSTTSNQLLSNNNSEVNSKNNINFQFSKNMSKNDKKLHFNENEVQFRNGNKNNNYEFGLNNNKNIKNNSLSTTSLFGNNNSNFSFSNNENRKSLFGDNITTNNNSLFNNDNYKNNKRNSNEKDKYFCGENTKIQNNNIRGYNNNQSINNTFFEEEYNNKDNDYENNNLNNENNECDNNENDEYNKLQNNNIFSNLLLSYFTFASVTSYFGWKSTWPEFLRICIYNIVYYYTTNSGNNNDIISKKVQPFLQTLNKNQNNNINNKIFPILSSYFTFTSVTSYFGWKSTWPEFLKICAHTAVYCYIKYYNLNDNNWYNIAYNLLKKPIGFFGRIMNHGLEKIGLVSNKEELQLSNIINNEYEEENERKSIVEKGENSRDILNDVNKKEEKNGNGWLRSVFDWCRKKFNI